MLEFLKPTEFIEMGIDFNEETKRTVFHFKGYHNKELTSEREFRIALEKEDIDKIIGSLVQIKEKL